ncbi:MAG: type VII secretion protein EccB, partial [Mycobacterium sp.]|nr:type VII secretion protein EccB [Mycobacterium sp.]
MSAGDLISGFPPTIRWIGHTRFTEQFSTPGCGWDAWSRRLASYRERHDIGATARRAVSRQAATWLYASGYRFLLRRVERALLRGRTEGVHGRTASLTLGCALAALAVAVCAVLGLLHPRVSLDHARIVMGSRSGALYVRVGETWHPVLNLTSARLIAATAADPQPIPESELTRTKRGATLGIPGAPQLVGAPLSAAESLWTICDSGDEAVTTVIVGHPE